MDTMVWLVVGGSIGWLASVLVEAEGRQILLNVMAGIVGAAVGTWLLRGTFGVATIDQSTFGIWGVLFSLPGAVVLLSAAKLARVL